MINCVGSGAIWLRFSDGWPQCSKATRMTKAAKRAAPFLLQLQLQSKEPTGRMNNKTLQHDSGGGRRTVDGGQRGVKRFFFVCLFFFFCLLWTGLVNDQCGNFECG